MMADPLFCALRIPGDLRDGERRKRQPRRSQRPCRGGQRGLAVLALLVLGWSGCTRVQPLNTSYGKRAGDGAVSVNGTSVLAGMFEHAGYRVTTSRFLGHAVRTADVVVWCPDSFELPTDRVVRFFDAWLSERQMRTLVFIGRDYDGAIDYWRQISAQARRDDVVPLREQLAERVTEMQIIRASRPERMECEWFVQRAVSPGVVGSAIGGRWADIAHSDSVSIPVHSRLESRGGSFRPPRDESLLTVNDQTLALRHSRSHWLGSQVIATNSGAWLLNVALVRRGHRELARKLIEECGPLPGPGRKKVVFLESSRQAPTESQATNRPYWLEAFTVWPFSSILIHATLAGVVLCLAVFPIFGRPQEGSKEGHSDFGRHVRAIGRLTAATHDESSAQRQRQAYWTLVRHIPLAHAPAIESLEEPAAAPPGETTEPASPPVATSPTDLTTPLNKDPHSEGRHD